MLSTQKYADVLQEQAYKTLTPQIQALEDEMREIKKLLAAKIQSVEYKLEVLRNTELPAAWPILNDYLQDDIKKRYLDGEMLALFARELRTKETQEEILVALLDNAANCFPRIALFAVRGDMFKGWSSRGFSDSVARIIGSDEFPQSDCSWLLEVLVNGKQAESADLPDAGSLCLMREESSGAWRLYPLYALGRPVAILLAGEAEDAAARPEVLSVLVDCVALRLENVALKIIKAFGGSAPANAGAAAFSADPCFNASFVLSLNLTAPIEIPEPASPVDEPRPDPGALLPNPLAELKLVEPIPEPSGVLSLNLTAPIEIPAPASPVDEPRSDPGAFLPNPLAELKLVEPIPEPSVEIPAVASESEWERIVESAAVNSTGESGESESEQPGLDTPPQSPSNAEEEKLHAAAKRFAKLLVYEIRFYNEDAVTEGRKNRDLYHRLQRDMNRSREMYEKRVAPSVAFTIDYLHEEFVRTLGNGDAGAFGDGYPGPVVGRITRMARF